MGRSRKKGSAGRGGHSAQGLRRWAVFFIILCAAALVAAAALISGGIRSRRNGTAAPSQEVASDGGGAQGAAASSDPGAASSELEMVIEPDTKEYFQDFGGSILTKDGSPEAAELMERYFTSISDCDMDTFFSLFTSQSTEGEADFQKEFRQQKQYIEGYQNISCYTAPGLSEGELAAYVYYEIRYAGVETPAPGLVQIYAVRGEDGRYRIFDGEPSPELSSYLEQLAANEDVRLLSIQVDQQMEAAMEADEGLRERVEFMKRGPAYMQEESADSPENPPEGTQ